MDLAARKIEAEKRIAQFKDLFHNPGAVPLNDRQLFLRFLREGGYEENTTEKLGKRIEAENREVKKLKQFPHRFIEETFDDPDKRPAFTRPDDLTTVFDDPG